MTSETSQTVDCGLGALVMLLRFQGVGVDPEQIRHQFGATPIGVPEMLRCAKGFGLKARSVTTKWERLGHTPLPGIAALRDGSFLLIGKVSEDKIIVQAPGSPRPTLMTRAELEAVWDGRLVLMAKRAALTDLARRFDITWFLGAIHKYRRLLGEVLVASFFLQLGVVLQDNVLFNRSVRDNIALADPAMPTERVIAAAKLAGAHDFILELSQGYDTIVGERGSSLSGGQRQRVAIARALITDPRILIFDEATSALDYESERIVQQNMAQMAHGRTVFVIAHRLSALRMADRIITIERGRLIEDGTHDELIKTGGRYATLSRLQAGLHEVR